MNSAGEISYSIWKTNALYKLQTSSVLKGIPSKSDMGNNMAVVRVSNVAGNTDQTFNITVEDKTAPVITGSLPADNAVNVSIKPSL